MSLIVKSKQVLVLRDQNDNSSEKDAYDSAAEPTFCSGPIRCGS